MHPRVDYDAIAGTYDQRYVGNDYSGVENALIAFAAQNPGFHVLEVGCGTGHWLRLLRERGIRATGLDASAQMLARAYAQDRRAAVVHGHAEALPWTAESFDRLFCVNAFHHFRDKRTFVTEARRVLRPGGRLMTIGLDPHTELDRWYVYEHFEPVLELDRRRYIATGQIRQWMNAVGFVDVVTREVQHLPVRLPARAAIEQGRLDKNATSQLSLLTDEQYQQGIERIRKAIESAEASGRMFYLTADLRLYATVGSVPS